MDPNTLLDIALDATYPTVERLEAARNLRDWLHGGGFPPVCWSHRESMPAIGRIISKLEVIAHTEANR